MRPLLSLRVGGGTARADLVHRGRTLWAGEATCSTPPELAEAIAQLAGEGAVAGRPARIAIVFESPPAQVRTLHGLPPVRPAELRALVAAQAGRFFRRGTLVTDAVWVTGARRRETACAAAVEEAWVQAVAQGAEAARLTVATITMAGGDGGALHLVSAEERARRARRDRLAVRRLGWIAGLVWVSALSMAGLRLHRERQDIERRIAALERPARAVTEARRGLDRTTATIETIRRADRMRGAMLARIAAIGAALPDSAYLTALSLDAEGSGSLAGLARHSAQVLAALDAGGAVPGIRALGPVVRETASGRSWERFAMTFGPGAKR